MIHVQSKKDALATLVEIEHENLRDSIEALRNVAKQEVAEIKGRVEKVVDKLDIKQAIVAHRYQILVGAFALGVFFGVRRMWRGGHRRSLAFPRPGWRRRSGRLLPSARDA